MKLTRQQQYIWDAIIACPHYEPINSCPFNKVQWLNHQQRYEWIRILPRGLEYSLFSYCNFCASLRRLREGDKILRLHKRFQTELNTCLAISRLFPPDKV